MEKIGFIGVGNMGGHMARNLIKAGHDVTVFDVAQDALDSMASDGATIATSAGGAARYADVVLTMLPAGNHVESVYCDDVFPHARAGTIFIDCSTIDIETSRRVNQLATEKGHSMLDAPVSGGVVGATNATLTIMVGGDPSTFGSSEKILHKLGENVVYCGGPGTGQAAKLCNNMMLGIQMASVAEAFILAERLGLEHQKLFDVASISSGQCWALSSYCPVPGPVPSSPANYGYNPGFATALMLKDMELALEAAKKTKTELGIAISVAQLYRQSIEPGLRDKDFSNIVNFIRDKED